MEDQESSILGGYKDIHLMSPFLARVHEYFKGYPHYICPVTICDEGEADFGFLLLEHHPDVERALGDIHYINGKPVQIGRILFLSGLPRDTTSAELAKFFSKFGEVEECEIASDKSMWGRPADFGLIVFKCSQIVDELAAKGRIHFGGNEVVVKKAKILNLNLSLDKKVRLVKRFKDNLQRGAAGAAGADGAFAYKVSMMLNPSTAADWIQLGDCCEAPGAPHVVCSVMERASDDMFTKDGTVDDRSHMHKWVEEAPGFFWMKIPSLKSKLFRTKCLF